MLFTVRDKSLQLRSLLLISAAQANFIPERQLNLREGHKLRG